MKRITAIAAAVTLALISFTSCEINIGTPQEVSIDAYLTAYYAGGLPSYTSQGRYTLRSQYLSGTEIEDIFYELCHSVPSGFTDAILEIEFYDWMNNFKYMRTFYFWWEYYDYVTGDGYYAWQERQ